MTHHPTKLDLSVLMRHGIKETLPATGAMHDPEKEQACALGCIKIALDEPRWHRVKSYLANTTIDAGRLPDVEIMEDTVLANVIEDSGSPSLHLILTSLNDMTSMSRTAIANWLDRELSDHERIVRFGKDRDLGYTDKANADPVPA